MKEPFFSLVLTLSTHSPYNKHVGADFLSDNKTLTKEYRNYLNSCHFLDEQLRAYFCTLKETGLFDVVVKCYRDIKATVKVEVVGVTE